MIEPNCMAQCLGPLAGSAPESAFAACFVRASGLRPDFNSLSIAARCNHFVTNLPSVDLLPRNELPTSPIFRWCSAASQRDCSICNLSIVWPLINNLAKGSSCMRIGLVLLELSAIVVLPAFAFAQVPAPPAGSNSSVTCAPLAPSSSGANSEPSSSMNEMCTAADPWQSKTTGVHNKDQVVVGDKLRTEHP